MMGKFEQYQNKQNIFYYQINRREFMHFFNCDRPQSPKSSEPTIPLILRGKKKQFQKRNLQQSLIGVSQPSRKIEASNRYVQHPVITRVQPPIIHYRSVSVPRNITIFRPIVTRVASPIKITTLRHPTPIKKVSRTAINSKGDQIRRNLDENLSKVYKALNQRKLTFDVQNNKIYSSPKLSGPRLQEQLVQQYIKLIYQDYKIKDPLQASSTEMYHRNSISASSEATQPNRRTQTNKKRGQSILHGSTNRKAVQLKQSFLIQMFSPAQNESPVSHQNNRQHSISKSQRNSHKNRPTSDVNTFGHSGQLAEITQMCQKQIGQTYRYCFVCEEPILEVNIDVHQRQKCPQFCNLYDMSLNEIKKALVRKILRLRQQCEYNYDIVFGNEHQKQIKLKLQNLKRETKRFLTTVDTNARSIELEKPADKIKAGQYLVSKNQLKNQFGSVMDCYEEHYFKLYENLRKLQWFSLMLRNLEQKYYNIKQNKQKLETRKDVQNNIFPTQSQELSHKRFSLAY